MIKKITPKEYDYLWADHGVNYIFTSCYLFKSFRQADIVLIYDHLGKGLKFFLAKTDRRKFANYGLQFFKDYFPAWKKKILLNIWAGEALVKQTEKDKKNIRLLSNRILSQKIYERASAFQRLGDNYFFTEFFFLDKVEKQLNGTVAKNFQLMGPLKYRARRVLNKFYNYSTIFAPYIREAKRRTGRTDLEWLSFQEVMHVLEGRPVGISRRGVTNWVLAKRCGWRPYRGLDAELLIHQFSDHFFTAQRRIIRGIIANKGRRKGVARVIKTIFSQKIITELKKINKGDILIAETTGPEMMVACKKAAAIITDEGGLTSHAAIVSRELKIPCLVGTKIASKVIKDGDLVEVDANKGIIRILK